MAPSAQVVYNAVLRNDGEVHGSDIYAGRAGVTLAFLRTAEVLRRGKLRLQASSQDGAAQDDAAAVRFISCVLATGQHMSVCQATAGLSDVSAALVGRHRDMDVTHAHEGNIKAMP